MPNVQNVLANDHKDLMNQVRQFITGYGTFPTPGYAGVGDGTISDVASPPPSLSETWTITCNLGGGTGVATFTVSGSVSGAQADATVGEFYDGAGGLFEFLIKDGPIDFVIADVFTVVITEGAMITSAEEWLQDRWIPAPNDIETGSNFDVNRLLFDGNPANLQSAVRTGATNAIVQFSVDDAVEYDQYTIFSQTTSFLLANMPLDWTFEWSDDLTGPWTIVDTVVGFSSWTSGNAHNFSVVSAGRHFNWRLVITNNNGGVDVDMAFFETQVIGQLINSLAEGHLLVTGQGLAQTDTIFVGMSIRESTLTPFFNWRLRGAVAFDPQATFQNQPSSSPNTYYSCDDGTVEYWLIATGRYFIVVTKISTVYTSMMMGFMLPYGVPAEYGYPLVIAGNNGTTPLHFNTLQGRFRMFCNPGDLAFQLRTPDGSWRTFTNFTGTTPSEVQRNDRCITPYAGTLDAITTSWLNKITEGIDGSYPLTPLIIAEFENNAGEAGRDRNSYGELDGVFHVSGSNNTPENTTVIDGDTYIFFPDIFRLGFHQFMAVRLDT